MGKKDEVIGFIHEVLQEWKVAEADCKDREKEIWWLVQGSADFHIELYSQDTGRGQRDCIEIAGKIMDYPKDEKKQFALLKHLMDMNATSMGVWFGLRGNLVMLIHNREISGLDRDEFRSMLDDVRFYSDKFDDDFRNRFGDEPVPPSKRGPVAM